MVVQFFVLASSGWAADSQRSQVFQQYQEGLFYETDIGNLALAQKAYQAVAQHSEYPELAAAAIYRLGLIHEKSGNIPAAKKAFYRIISEFDEQKSLVRQAETRLMHYVQKQVEIKSEPKKSVKTKPGIKPAPKRKHLAQPAESKKPPPFQDPSLAGKIGFGLSATTDQDLSIHLRLAAAEQMMWEIFARSRANYWAGGMRGYYLTQPVAPGVPLRPYVGLALSLEPSRSGYRFGVFVGTEYLVGGRLGLGLDGGYYYRKYEDEQRIIQEAVPRANLCATIYF